jgi:hypothetical protein
VGLARWPTWSALLKPPPVFLGGGEVSPRAVGPADGPAPAELCLACLAGGEPAYHRLWRLFESGVNTNEQNRRRLSNAPFCSFLSLFLSLLSFILAHTLTAMSLSSSSALSALLRQSYPRPVVGRALKACRPSRHWGASAAFHSSPGLRVVKPYLLADIGEGMTILIREIKASERLTGFSLSRNNGMPNHTVVRPTRSSGRTVRQDLRGAVGQSCSGGTDTGQLFELRAATDILDRSRPDSTE